MNLLTVVILTFDEEDNIEKCIRSILPVTNNIYIVDSFSTDKTVDICKSLGARVLQHEWTLYAEQFNWGLDNFDIKTTWTMRMDADEELTPELQEMLPKVLANAAKEISGYYLRRRVYFMGRWIKHGGYYPTWLLRVFRTGVGRCEARFMDEHIIVNSGKTEHIKTDIIDKNNKDLTFWTDKHNHYATREVNDILNKSINSNNDEDQVTENIRGKQDEIRRWAKKNLYLRLPLFLRPFLYFIYRYFFRLGFLDGKEGLIFHFLQGFWYRFLVDAKYYEHKKNSK